MSLAHRPDAVLKTLMSAHELRSAQRAALLFFDDIKAGPAGGMELTAAWLSSQSLSPWLNESNLYEEPAFCALLQPYRAVVITAVPSDPRLAPCCAISCWKCKPNPWSSSRWSRRELAR